MPRALRSRLEGVGKGRALSSIAPSGPRIRGATTPTAGSRSSSRSAGKGSAARRMSGLSTQKKVPCADSNAASWLDANPFGLAFRIVLTGKGKDRGSNGSASSTFRVRMTSIPAGRCRRRSSRIRATSSECPWLTIEMVIKRRVSESLPAHDRRIGIVTQYATAGTAGGHAKISPRIRTARLWAATSSGRRSAPEPDAEQQGQIAKQPGHEDAVAQQQPSARDPVPVRQAHEVLDQGEGSGTQHGPAALQQRRRLSLQGADVPARARGSQPPDDGAPVVRACADDVAPVLSVVHKGLA